MINQVNGLQITYRRRGWFIWVFLGVFMAYFIALDLLQKPPRPLVNLIFISIALLLALLTIYSGLTTRLAVSSEGIMYLEVGYSIFAKWEQVKSVGECRSGMVRTECLMLKEYELRGVRWLANINGKSIPVGLFVGYFDPNWRETKLGRNIEQYVPHVLIGSG